KAPTSRASGCGKLAHGRFEKTWNGGNAARDEHKAKARRGAARTPYLLPSPPRGDRPASARAGRRAGAADGVGGGAARHIALVRRANAGVQGHAGERDTVV